jgi:Tfp pilus assembly major pilin PilA
MNKNQILIYSAVAAILAIRLYQKYVKKGKAKSGTETKSSSGASFPTASKDEDYEPYSKK